MTTIRPQDATAGGYPAGSYDEATVEECLAGSSRRSPPRVSDPGGLTTAEGRELQTRLRRKRVTDNSVIVGSTRAEKES